MLSPAEQAKIIQLLGYGGKTIQAGSVIYNKILNDRMHQLPPDSETIIRGYLASVAVIEGQMTQAPARLAAASVDDVKMNLDELPMLRRERKRIGREIAAFLDIPYMGIGSANVGIRS